MPGEIADYYINKHMGLCDSPGREDWEICAEAEHGLPYFPRRLSPDVRRALIQAHREAQIKRIAELAKKIALFPKP